MAASELYVISEGPAGPVKIGRSKNANHRLLTLQTGNPRPLNLFAMWILEHGCACDAERILREEWANRSMKGEWYVATESFAVAYVQDMIKAHGLAEVEP